MSVSRIIMSLIAAFCMIVAGHAPASAQKKTEIYQSGKSQLGRDLALGGHDAVAYHTQKQAVPGSADFAAEYRGAVWRFANKANLEAFAKSPDAYAPQFGGYCAYAVSYGSTAPGDPKVFSLVDGKLYLNLNPGIQKTWEKDRANLIVRGQKNWPAVLAK